MLKRGTTVVFCFMIMISINLFGAFEKLENAERTIFGFRLSTANSYEERITIVEEKLYGKVSSKAILERESDMYNLLFVDGKYYSILTKISNVEEFLFRQKNITADLLSRLEKIENYLFNNVYNKETITFRVKNIYRFLSLRESDFILKGNGVGVINSIKITLPGTKTKFRKGEKIVFEIAEDVEGVLFKGDKLSGEITEVKNAGFMSDEEIEVVLTKGVGSDGREYDIYKRFFISGTKKNLIGGKTIEIKKTIYID